MTRKVIASVKALIIHNEKALFVYEKLCKNGVWDLPGGKIEYGESPHDALIREVQEELCIAITIGKSAGIYWFYSEHHKYQVICSTYLCTLVGNGEIDISKNPADENITEYRWLTRNEILKKEGYSMTESLYSLLESTTF